MSSIFLLWSARMTMRTIFTPSITAHADAASHTPTPPALNVIVELLELSACLRMASIRRSMRASWRDSMPSIASRSCLISSMSPPVDLFKTIKPVFQFAETGFHLDVEQADHFLEVVKHLFHVWLGVVVSHQRHIDVVQLFLKFVLSSRQPFGVCTNQRHHHRNGTQRNQLPRRTGHPSVSPEDADFVGLFLAVEPEFASRVEDIDRVGL